MNSKAFNRTALSIAMGLGLATLAPMALAQDGSVVGQSQAGAQVTVTNPQTGFSRSVTAGSDGSYRFPFLPVGTYQLQTRVNGQPVGEPVRVRVGLGNATYVGVADDGVANLGTVQVTGSRVINAVDVTSTESATNVTAEQIARLPVPRDVSSVALLAPGVAGGSAGFGGISFGGSSVAENAFYINGLNVTDFYNRVGFSEAPFDFYEEFQVKTGGYSVEFGRTTGGVVNAVAKSGTNEFHAGAKFVWSPREWASEARDSYFEGERYIARSQDSTDTKRLNLWASGPIVKDRLFFFAMYEGRDVRPQSTDDEGQPFYDGQSDDGFWGTTLDWQVTDNNLLSLMAFSNQNSTSSDVFDYDFDADVRGAKIGELTSESGGRNWALTWTSYLTNNFSMKLMAGSSERNDVGRSPADPECNYVTSGNGVVNPGISIGCNFNSSIYDRADERDQVRADFEWSLGDHLLRFGVDRETNTSELDQRYPGPERFQYNVYSTEPGTFISSSGGGIVPDGYFAYVRARRYELNGNFETTNDAWYVEDNWSVTDNLVLNLGIRNEGFDNKDELGSSYIKMDDMWAPRLGFSWDMKSDGTTKLFGNAGRYFLPVANVINVKQGGALLDERIYYAFDGWETREYQGNQYAFPILGEQFGYYNGQGDGTLGDLRSEVDADMDPVYQDELILGFQQQLSTAWSWGARGIYRELNNAIDDIGITATQCGRTDDTLWVMANPGEEVTIWGDTDCDGANDGYITVDTATQGYWTEADNYEFIDGEWEYVGSTPTGERGWVKPERTYKALELQIDRAWDDKWAFNASYTLSYSEGNAEGPVNTDTNFGDAGRTENFDDPFVNLDGDGPLANDHRHQIKLRGTYALNDHWRVGATVDARSGGPITAFGVGSPFDWDSYHSYYICVDNCTLPETAMEGDTWSTDDRVFEHSPRGGAGRMPWTYDIGASVAYERSFGWADFSAKLAVYNLLDNQEPVWVYQELEPGVGDRDEFFGQERFLQSPRYAQLILSLSY